MGIIAVYGIIHTNILHVKIYLQNFNKLFFYPYDYVNQQLKY